VFIVLVTVYRDSVIIHYPYLGCWYVVKCDSGNIVFIVNNGKTLLLHHSRHRCNWCIDTFSLCIGLVIVALFLYTYLPTYLLALIFLMVSIHPLTLIIGLT